MATSKRVKIGIVSSSGGHLYKTYRLKSWWSRHSRFWVTKQDKFTKSLLVGEKAYYGYFPENRSLINFFKNLKLAYFLLKKEKPTILFSTGAGIAPPFFLIAKIFGIKTIFMETFVFIPKTTLSGRMIYRFADYFLVQHRDLLKKYPRAQYFGKCL